MTNPNASSEQDEFGELLEHEYDGIREYDNPTPGWWHIIFLGSIAFGVIYFSFFTFSTMAWTPQSRLAAAQTREFEQMFAQIGELKPDEPTLLELMVDPKWMAVAQGLFATNCTSCHGAEGQGLVGPNFTDDSYKNIKVITDIPRVIRDGAANGAMPAWGNRLTPTRLCYWQVISLRCEARICQAEPPKDKRFLPGPHRPRRPRQQKTQPVLVDTEHLPRTSLPRPTPRTP